MRYLFITIVLAFGIYILGTILLVVAGLNDELGHADLALVLGSKVELNGTPSLRLKARLDRTLELYRAGYFPSIIVSGGFGKEGYDEATVMRDYLVANGVPSERVILDSHGDTTFASAKNTRQIASQQKFKSVLVISQYFHIPRAKLALRRFQFSKVYSAHARFFEIRDIYSSLRESAGYLSYYFRSYELNQVRKP
jgi:vancomycin permeability regulator SanA